MRALLAPDGLLLGAFIGDGSLPRQRRAVMSEGVRSIARLHPQIDLSSMGNLLQRTGFARNEVLGQPTHRYSTMGLDAPAQNYRQHTIMGKVFDPAQPEAYLKSFAIRRS